MRVMSVVSATLIFLIALTSGADALGTMPAEKPHPKIVSFEGFHELPYEDSTDIKEEAGSLKPPETAYAEGTDCDQAQSLTLETPRELNSATSSALQETVEQPFRAQREVTTKTRTLVIGGTEISYIFSYDAPEAPASGAGVWMGSDSTTDGSFCYFIGHNPGSFQPVTHLQQGDEVSVYDSEGSMRTYYVVDTFEVPVGSTWSDVTDRVTCYGESIALQTCVNAGYRIVVAA